MSTNANQANYSFAGLGGAAAVAQALNRGCDCRSLDPERLRQHLEAEPALLGLAAGIDRSHECHVPLLTFQTF